LILLEGEMVSTDKTKQSIYPESYGSVILLDSLGTKGIWKNREPDDVLGNWENLVKAFKEHIQGKPEYKESKIFAFSDTIVITIKGTDVKKILFIAGQLTSILVSTGLSVGIYLRGCISIGTFYESKNIILGPAIDEAAENYEKADVIGVFATPSAYSVLRRYYAKDSSLRRAYKEYEVPTKNGKINTWVVNIDNQLPELFWKAMDDSTTIIDFIHKKLERSKDVDGQEKWKNFLDFMYQITPKK